MPFYDFWRTKRITRLGHEWNRLAAEFTLQRVSRVTHPLRHLLEIGPGRGAFANACRQRGLHYTAVDANAGLLRYLQPVDGVCSFVPPLPLQDGACDLIVANHVFEHAAGLPQAQALLREMARVVRPGGCIALTSPDLLWVGSYFWDCDYSHNFPTSARRLHQIFLDNDLEVVHLEYVHNHLTGLRGYLAGKAVRHIPYRLFYAQPTSPRYLDQIYKARLTFSRAVLIIGRTPAKSSQ